MEGKGRGFRDGKGKGGERRGWGREAEGWGGVGWE